MEQPFRKVKILFFCFGYSIHAFRRISIFSEDPNFDVNLISNYFYQIPNSKTYLIERPKYFITFKKDSIFEIIIGLLLFPIYLFSKTILQISNKQSNLFHEFIWLIKEIIRVRNISFKINPDLIFLQTLMYPSYLSFFLNKKIQSIVTFWNGDLIWWAKSTGIENFFKKQIVNYGIHRSKAITVNSSEAFKICLNYGINSKKVYKLQYPGIDLTVFKPKLKSEARQKLKINCEIVIFMPRGFHGFNNYLNNKTIFKAASDLNKIYNNKILFLFTNSMEDLEWSKIFTNKEFALDKPENFRNDNFVKYNDMPDYYAAADLVISLSSNDSLPNTMLEAMACKRPLIMGDISQIKDWIIDGHNGFLCHVNDSELLRGKIIEILANKNNIAELFTEKNYNLVQQEFDSEQNSKKIKEIVNNLVK